MRQAAFLLLWIFLGYHLNGQENVLSNKVVTNPALSDYRQEIILDKDQYLFQAKSSERSPYSISLELEGMERDYYVTPNDVLGEESRRELPNLMTFDLHSKNQTGVYGAMTVSEQGVYVTLINGKKMISIYPKDHFGSDIHIVEYGHQPDLPQLKQFCELDHDHNEDHDFHKPTNYGNRSNITIGGKRNTYTLAVVTTGEFYIKNGNNPSSVRTVVVNTVNAISAIFNNEMSIRLRIDNRIFLYDDPATDVFFPDELGGDPRPTQAGNAVALNFSSGAYNIGHVFHQHEDGDGWGNGGIAQLRSVCNSNGSPISKARGWSGAYSNVGNSWINLATHEFGHQFGANHTFNGDGNSCTSAINDENAYEIGSGTTIMSYNGICNDNQNIPNSNELDNYFHIKSLEEMYDFVTNGTGATCGNSVTTTNILPSVDANPCNANYTIPKNTPFYLNAKGEWTDSDKHTYCWEQIDEDGLGTPTQGKIGTSAANDNKAPLFRSYPPSPFSYRYFPSQEILRSGLSAPFDVLSNVARTLHFNVALRDNNSGGGAIANDEVAVTVANVGPLVINRPNGSETFMAGQTENIIWNTNGSNSLCSKVRIKLSIDGGVNYSILVAENVDYAAGSFMYQLPLGIINSNLAKIMIECMDVDCFKFFAISPKTFKIQSTCLAPNTLINPDQSLSVDQGSIQLNLGLTSNVGTQILFPLTSSINKAEPIRRTSKATVVCGTSDCTNFSGGGDDFYFDEYKFRVSVGGNYTFTQSSSISLSMALYIDRFDPDRQCTNLIGSSRCYNLPNTISGTVSPVTVNLQPGIDYVLAVSNYFFEDRTGNYTINVTVPNGGGLYNGVFLPPDYIYVYVAVDAVTNKIAGVNGNSNFTAISAGTYCVYGVAVANTTDIATWEGQSFTELIARGDCFLNSDNCKPLTVKSVCVISDVTAGVQGICVASTNTFTQDLIVTYDKAPVIGQLSVNGQLFNITSSPQTVTLANIDSDGLPRDLNVFFTALTDCKFTKSNAFTAPVNCCPLNFDLGPEINKCIGETVLLNAGDNGVEYTWKRDGVVISSTNSKTLPVLTSGLYEVVVKHSSGCQKTDAVQVTFNSLPTVVLNDNQTFCEGETYSLTANIINGTQIEWYNDNILIPDATTATIQITNGGIYKIIATSEFGCKSQVETIVTTIKAPIVDLGPNQQKCENDKSDLNAGNDGTKYEWYKDGIIIGGATSSIYSPVESGNYRVIVTNTSQCRTEDIVKVDFFANPVITGIPLDTNFCLGSQGNLVATIDDFQTLQWTYDDNIITGSNGPSIMVNNTGVYALEATNLAGCKTKMSTNVNIRTLPNISFGDDIVSCIGNPVTLDAGPDGTTYFWTKDGAPLSQNERNLLVDQDGNYKVIVTNQFKCENTDEVNISFIEGPTVSLNGDKTICEGESHVITVTTNANSPEVKWFSSNGQISGETGLSLLVTLAGNYEVTVKGGTPACTVRKSVNITVNPKPAFNLGNDRTLCEGDTPPVLNAGQGNTSFEWTLDGVALATTQTVTANKSGTYSVKVGNSFNCERTEKVKITYELQPTLNLIDSLNLCTGKEVLVTAETNGTTFEWKKNNVVLPGESGKELKINSDGIYTFITKSAANCKKEKSFKVTSRPSPIIDLGPDFSLCPNETKTLNLGNQLTYLWSDNSTSASLIINANEPASLMTRLYSVTVTNAFGCNSEDSISVTLFPVVQGKLVADQPGVCNGEPVTLTASGGLKYQWTDPDGGTLSTLTGPVTIASPVKTTTYTVEISDTNCANNKVNQSIEIKVFEPVDVSAGVDTCVIIGRTIKLNATGGTKYQWDNLNTIEGPSNISNPVIRPLTETVYSVTITDQNGCEFIDEVTVCVKEDLFKPVSIITPNNDGKNDELFFGGLSDYPDNTLRVFNRWGNVIFEANGYQINGDLFKGYRNGERLPADTYYYILTFGDQVIKSSLTILWD